MPGRKAIFPLSRAHLRKFAGFSPKYEFLDYFATRDVQFEFTDFTGGLADGIAATGRWVPAAGGGATTWATTLAKAGGWARGVSGATAATSGLQLSKGTAAWTPASNAGMCVAFQMSDGSAALGAALIDQRIEIGFVNAMPAVNTTIVNSLATPTFNTSASAALWVFDNASAANTLGLYTKGSTVAAAKVATTANIPVHKTTYFVMIQFIGNGKVVQCTVGNESKIYATSAATPVDITDTLMPCISYKNAGTTSTNVDIDYIGVWSERV